MINIEFSFAGFVFGASITACGIRITVESDTSVLVLTSVIILFFCFVSDHSVVIVKQMSYKQFH